MTHPRRNPTRRFAGLPGPNPGLVVGCTLAAAMLMFPGVTQAQDGAEAAEAESLNYAEAFLFPEGSGPIGLAIIWTLVLLVVATTGFALQLVFKHRRKSVNPPALEEELNEMLANQEYREAIEASREEKSYLGKITAAALTEAPNGYGAMERAIEEAGDAEATRMLRPIEYLNVVGNIAPMMGLFGTVYGMIEAFQQLASSGGSPDPAELAGGISTALVTTFWGLVVAIPALAAYALVRNRVDALTAEALLSAEALIAPFKPSKKKKRKGSSSSSSSSGGSDSSSKGRATPQPDDED